MGNTAGKQQWKISKRNGRWYVYDQEENLIADERVETLAREVARLTAFDRGLRVSIQRGNDYFIPTPEEYDRARLAIQATWSESQRAIRSGENKPTEWEPPIVSTEAFGHGSRFDRE